MKVFHIESGLGNQMLDYADLLASRLVNPNEEYYIETILFDLNDIQKSISMWNGYELEKIFGIEENNISSLFSDTQWKEIINDVIKSDFWNDGWTYSDAIINALRKQGLVLHDQHPRVHTGKKVEYTEKPFYRYYFRNIYYHIFKHKTEKDYACPEQLFRKSNLNCLDGHYLKFLYKGNNIELIEKELRMAFKFPQYDKKNKEFAQHLQTINSVAIHARRGDFLGHNSYCYKYGFFRRSIRYIKNVVTSPVFVFFCDPGSVNWVKNNPEVFGLDYKKDDVMFVDWNMGNDSYRDMQLMSDCKHNIITNSSFGWWASYLNQNPNKIVCVPDPRINGTNWF